MKLNLILILIVFSLSKTIGQNKKFRITNNCDEFSYSFEKPNNWVIDSTNTAQYLAHSAIYKSKKDYDNGGSLIQVFAFKKQDENTIEDLNFDINSYKERYVNLKQKDLKINHTSYVIFSKEVYVDSEFHQYIVYLNPGKEFKFGVSVALNINKTALSNTDLEIFKNLVKSVKAKKTN